jgi:hypothetical protein
VKIKLVPDQHLKEKEINRSGMTAFNEANVEEGAIADYIIKRYVPLRLRPTYSIFRESRKWITPLFMD